MNNPFSVITPENITSDEIKSMFVENSDFLNLKKKGHTFLHGHRGCGKSMALQVLRSKHFMKYLDKNEIEELPFICAYIPIKSSILGNVELDRFKDDILGKYFAEHMLSLHFAIHICKEMIDLIDFNKIQFNVHESEGYLKKLSFIGFDISSIDINKIISGLLQLFDDQWSKDNILRRKISFAKNIDDIEEPNILLTYHEFLLPLIKLIKNIDTSNKLNKDMYLLVDDADNLPIMFTKILNEWVSYRDIDNFSLKISTQLRYKTYQTISNNRIEKPHDYSEIFFSYVVSSADKADYRKLIQDIVEKRLKRFNINRNALEFFPLDGKQEHAIQEIENQYKKEWDSGSRKGNQRGDEAYRIARAEYIKRLGGPSKQKSTYKYSGFNQLVYISSGIVRNFLEPASKMYEYQKSKNNGNEVIQIDSSIQNNIIRNESDEFFIKQFKDLEDNIEPNEFNDEKIKKLKNFVTSLGENFHDILLSDFSERRIFSFAISDDSNIDNEIKSILKLGIEYGLFYVSQIGRKNSSGRTELYILTRLLAPHFTLDPNGFSGYQFLTTKWIKEAFLNPRHKLKKLEEDIEDLSNIYPRLPGFEEIL